MRRIEIDLIKFIAIVSVVMIYVSATDITELGIVGTWQYDASVVWRSLCGAGVPLFLMCSGALMLRPEKEITLKKLYLHNVLRLVTAMLFWAFAYKLSRLYLSGSLNFDGIIRSIKEILLFDQEFHLYYIHIMLLVYFFLPVTRSFVKNASEREMRYFLLIWLILGIVYPTVKPFRPFSLITGFPLQWAINMTYASIGYGVLGWYLSSKRPSTGLGAALAGVGFAAVFLPTMLVSRANGTLYTSSLEGMSVAICLYASGIYILCLNFGGRIRKGRDFVVYMSKASFCIYLCHIFVLRLIHHFGGFNLATPIVLIPLLTIVITAASTAVYWVISHIPILKKWIV